MKRINFLVTLFISLSFFACTKDPGVEPDPSPAPTGNKLSRIEYDNGSYQTMSYNANGTVNKIVVHNDYGNNQGNTVTYDLVYTGTRLTEMTDNLGVKHVYTYQDQQLLKTQIFNAGGNMVAYYQYTYKNGQFWKTDGYARVGGVIAANPYVRYEQDYYANGNISKLTIYYRDATTNQLEKDSEYVMNEYDNKKNTVILFENNPYLPLENFNPNNPLKEFHYNSAAMLEETVTHSYTYDAGSNPLTRKTTTKITGSPEKVENARFYY